MKKVLILAYDFPPYVSVGGLRPYSWYKYLHEYNVYPIVITRQWANTHGNHLDYISPGESSKTIMEETPEGTIIRSPYTPNFANRIMLRYGESKYGFLRKAVSAYYELAQFVFYNGPKSSVYYAAKEYLKNNQVDVIIATGDPFILFGYASKLSKICNIPWIADYRDPWSQSIDNQKNSILRIWNSFFEKKIVNTASFIITVSNFLKARISEIITNKKFYILPNGYDPDAMDRVKNIEQESDILSIASVGTIYNWNPIRSFLSVVSNFVSNNNTAKLMINFYGTNASDEINELIKKDFPNLKKHIAIHPKAPNELLLKKLATENMMLLFNYYSFSGTKIYDYIGLKRCILFCYSNDAEAKIIKEKYYKIKELNTTSNHVQEDIIKDTHAGYIAEDSKQLLTLLEQLYSEFITTGQIQCNTVNAEKYSRKHQVKQLAELIQQLPSLKK